VLDRSIKYLFNNGNYLLYWKKTKDTLQEKVCDHSSLNWENNAQSMNSPDQVACTWTSKLLLWVY